MDSVFEDNNQRVRSLAFATFSMCEKLGLTLDAFMKGVDSLSEDPDHFVFPNNLADDNGELKQLSKDVSAFCQEISRSAFVIEADFFKSVNEEVKLFEDEDMRDAYFLRSNEDMLCMNMFTRFGCVDRDCEKHHPFGYPIGLGIPVCTSFWRKCRRQRKYYARECRKWHNQDDTQKLCGERVNFFDFERNGHCKTRNFVDCNSSTCPSNMHRYTGLHCTHLPFCQKVKSPEGCSGFERSGVPCSITFRHPHNYCYGKQMCLALTPQACKQQIEDMFQRGEISSVYVCELWHLAEEEYEKQQAFCRSQEFFDNPIFRDPLNMSFNSYKDNSSEILEKNGIRLSKGLE